MAQRRHFSLQVIPYRRRNFGLLLIPSYRAKDNMARCVIVNMTRYVIVLMRPTSIHFLLRVDSYYNHEHTTHFYGRERSMSETSSFFWIVTCIDPETEWNEKRFIASLARSEIGSEISQHPLCPPWMGLAASRDYFPGPDTDLQDIRLFSSGNHTPELIPVDVCRMILIHWPWVWPTLSHYDFGYATILSAPANSLYALSPASFVTAQSTPQSTFTSPAFISARSTPTFVQPSSAQLISNMYDVTTSRFTTIQEESDAPSLPPQLLKLKHEYLESLNEKSLLQSLDLEVNWSGKGQHVTFLPTEDIPLQHLAVLGASVSATVDKVLCRRVALARKTMRCTARFKVADALMEVTHLQKLRHFHIVQLVGSYLQGRNFSILMYPVADSHLGTFLEDTADMLFPFTRQWRFLASIFGCLASAFNFIHQHSTKHMDVKPQNILIRQNLVQEDWKGWRVYIADFGLSCDYTAQGHSQSDERTFLTPRYCAPEVYNFELRGRAADIFSLGCVFLEIMTVLTGQHPHEFAEFRSRESGNDAFHATLDRVALWCESYFHKGIGDTHTTSLRIDSSVCALVEKMVRMDPSQRPTASELHAFFTGLPENDSCKTKSNCCGRPPEPYIIAKLASTHSQNATWLLTRPR